MDDQFDNGFVAFRGFGQFDVVVEILFVVQANVGIHLFGKTEGDTAGYALTGSIGELHGCAFVVERSVGVVVHTVVTAEEAHFLENTTQGLVVRHESIEGVDVGECAMVIVLAKVFAFGCETSVLEGDAAVVQVGRNARGI